MTTNHDHLSIRDGKLLHHISPMPRREKAPRRCISPKSMKSSKVPRTNLINVMKITMWKLIQYEV
jgi:hypothetical protein